MTYNKKMRLCNLKKITSSKTMNIRRPNKDISRTLKKHQRNHHQKHQPFLYNNSMQMGGISDTK